MASMTNLRSTNKLSQQTQPGPTQLAALPDELLVHVLSKVPKEHRVGIRTVSQKWKNIISDLGYHIKPLFVTNGDHCLPYYPEEIQIHMNPVTSSFCYGLHDAATRFASCPLAHVGPFTSSDAQAKRSEFITSPPITTICISIWSFVEQRTATGVSITVISTPALMRSDQGIRVGDLVDVIDAVEASVPDEIPIEQRYAWFATVMGYGNFELVEEAKGKGGVEVRARRKNP